MLTWDRGPGLESRLQGQIDAISRTHRWIRSLPSDKARRKEGKVHAQGELWAFTVIHVWLQTMIKATCKQQSQQSDKVQESPLHLETPQGVSGLGRTQPAQGGDEARVDQSRKLPGNKCYHNVTVLSCSVGSDSCNHIECGLPGSSVHGILQARILEWVTMSLARS